MSKSSAAAAAAAVGRSATTERVLTGLLGVLVMVSGAAGLVVGHGLLGAFRANRPLLDPIAVNFVHAHLLASRIGALAAGVVLLILGLGWFGKALSTEPRPDLRLADDLVVSASAMTDAVSRDAESVAGVGRVKATLVGDKANPALRLTLWLQEGTDIRQVWAQLDDRVLSRARTSLEAESLPAAIRIELAARARQRVS